MLYFATVQMFFKTHPRRDEVSASDRIEILQLETRERVLEKGVLQRLSQHAQRLEEKLNVSELLPNLRKQQVLSEKEAQALSGEGLDKPAQSKMLLKFVGDKTPFWVVRFAECLRESPEHKHLSELLLPGEWSVGLVRGRIE